MDQSIISNVKNNFIGRTFRKLVAAREFTVLVLVMLVFVAMTFSSKYFLTSTNLISVMLGLASDGILAVAITFACVCGVFDFSIGSMMGFACMTTALLSRSMNIWVAVLLAFGLSILLGLINGIIIGKIRLNPLIATIGMSSVIRGIVYITSQGIPGQLHRNTDAVFSFLGQGKIFSIPVFVWIFLLIVILGDILLRRSVPLRKLFYTGSNEKAAILSGINTVKVKISVYVTTAGLAAVAGILTLARFGVATADTGNGAEMRVLSAVIIGGASISGGEGTVMGTFFGVILISLINNALVLLNFSIYWQTFVNGLMLLIAVTVDYFIHKNRAKKLIA